MAAANEAIEKVTGIVEKAMQQGADFFSKRSDRGLYGAYNFFNEAGGATEGKIVDSMKKAYTKNGDMKTPNLGAIAGSYLGVSAGYRVLSGGGLYKDKNGNTDIAGLPFL